MISDSSVNELGTGIVLGPVEVVSIALLTVPRSSRGTRERIKRTALDPKKTVRRVSGEMRRAAGKAAKPFRVTFEHLRDEAS